MKIEDVDMLQGIKNAITKYTLPILNHFRKVIAIVIDFTKFDQISTTRQGQLVSAVLTRYKNPINHILMSFKAILCANKMLNHKKYIYSMARSFIRIAEFTAMLVIRALDLLLPQFKVFFLISQLLIDLPVFLFRWHHTHQKISDLNEYREKNAEDKITHIQTKIQNHGIDCIGAIYKRYQDKKSLSDAIRQLDDSSRFTAEERETMQNEITSISDSGDENSLQNELIASKKKKIRNRQIALAINIIIFSLTLASLLIGNPASILVTIALAIQITYKCWEFLKNRPLNRFADSCQNCYKWCKNHFVKQVPSNFETSHQSMAINSNDIAQQSVLVATAGVIIASIALETQQLLKPS
tara:strand:- start:70 stop:1134 length:1065 start_codon:yes stop_codon:yes gene_type:complete